MRKEKIPVYDICSLTGGEFKEKDFMADRFKNYLQSHAPSLHLPHRHDFYHLVFFTKGSGFHTIDFTKFKVKAFDIYFMVPGQVHSWQFKGETDGYIVHFSENIFRSFLQNQNYLEQFSFFAGNAETSVCCVDRGLQTKLVSDFEDILKQAGVGSGLDMIRVLLIQIFLLVEQSSPAKNQHKILPTKQLLLKNFRKLIEQHYLTLRLPKLYADLLYVTPNHLNALCKDLLGKKAGDVIRERILLEAKRLLTNADMTITQIADALNFQDNSYFNRFFKKDTGLTPDAFRKQLFI